MLCGTTRRRAVPPSALHVRMVAAEQTTPDADPGISGSAVSGLGRLRRFGVVFPGRSCKLLQRWPGFAPDRRGSATPHVLQCMTMKNALTIRIEPDLERLLDRLCKETGRTRSDLVRDALRRQLQLQRFEGLRRRVLPFAEARGFLTDDDVMKALS